MPPRSSADFAEHIQQVGQYMAKLLLLMEEIRRYLDATRNEFPPKFSQN